MGNRDAFNGNRYASGQTSRQHQAGNRHAFNGNRYAHMGNRHAFNGNRYASGQTSRLQWQPPRNQRARVQPHQSPDAAPSRARPREVAAAAAC